MKLLPLLLTLTFISIPIFSQVVETIPEYHSENDSITIFLDTTQPGAEELFNYSGTIYAHTGVNTNFGNWQHVIGSWGNNQNQPALEKLGVNLYKLTVGFPGVFYGVINPPELIYQIAAVFRSADGSKQTRPDIFIEIYQPGPNVSVINPEFSVDFGDPQRSPVFVKQSSSVDVIVKSIQIGTEISTLSLYVDNTLVSQTTSDSLNYIFNYNDHSPGPRDVVAVGIDTAGSSDSTSFMMFVNPPMVNAPPPAGVEPGITINDPTKVTLLLFAPFKDFVYLIGDFNDWKVETQYFLNRFAFNSDSVVWWITLDNINAGNEIAFQYLVDAEIRVGDPFAHKVLDPVERSVDRQ